MRGSLSLQEQVRFRLRDVEHTKLPAPLRRGLTHFLPDPYDGRSANLDVGREIIFFHVPKTGGTSLAEALGLRHGHVPAVRFETKNPNRFSRAYKFAFVRDPVDRLYSSFNYLHTAIGLNKSPDVRWSETFLSGYKNFEEFVHGLQDQGVRRRIMEWPHFRPMHCWLCRPGEQTPLVDFLGRFECLAEDTAALAKELEVSVDLPHIRKPQAYLDKNITSEMEKIIRDIYRDDFEVFGY